MKDWKDWKDLKAGKDIVELADAEEKAGNEAELVIEIAANAEGGALRSPPEGGSGSGLDGAGGDDMAARYQAGPSTEGKKRKAEPSQQQG